MLLCELKEKQAAKITGLCAPKQFAVRLRDMGFCEGERVICVKRALLSSPILYCVKGTQIALRKADAAMIEVTR